MEQKPGSNTIDEYIATFPPDVQEKLQAIRTTIQAAVPDATEKISYQMPTFALHGNMLHFAAYKKHIGMYPAPNLADEFKEELSKYEGTGAKGTVRFPLDQPLPLDLISRIAQHRAAEKLEEAAAKARAKS